jgi:hypothetical protein
LTPRYGRLDITPLRSSHIFRAMPHGMALDIFQAADSNFYEARRFSEWKHQHRISGPNKTAIPKQSGTDIYSSYTWLSPLCFPSGESTHEPGSLACLIYRGRLHARQKLNSIGSTYPGGYKSFIRFEPRPDEGKEERCGAFCGLTTTNAYPAQLRTYVPELNIRGRTRG